MHLWKRYFWATEEEYSNIRQRFLIFHTIPKLFFFLFGKVLCFWLHLFPLHKVLDRDKASLDIFWSKDKSLADLDSLPAPDVLALDIIENLQSALDGFQELMQQLNTTPE